MTTFLPEASAHWSVTTLREVGLPVPPRTRNLSSFYGISIVAATAAYDSMNNPRDYGLLPAGEPVGPPVASPQKGTPQPCPNCGCATIMEIKVPMKSERIRGDYGFGYYLGCPACTWASPCAIAADPSAKPKE